MCVCDSCHLQQYLCYIYQWILLMRWTEKTGENYRSVASKWLNSSKIEQKNREKRHNRYLYNDRSLFWLVTVTSIKVAGLHKMYCHNPPLLVKLCVSFASTCSGDYGHAYQIWYIILSCTCSILAFKLYWFDNILLYTVTDRKNNSFFWYPVSCYLLSHAKLVANPVHFL